MKLKKQDKIDKIIKMLFDKGFYVEEYANGHIKVLEVNFWCTTEKWYDSKKNVKGIGMRTFLEHLKGVEESHGNE